MAKTRLGFLQSVVTGGLSVPRCRDKVMESSGRACTGGVWVRNRKKASREEAGRVRVPQLWERRA